jgi:hypothetical protein
MECNRPERLVGWRGKRSGKKKFTRRKMELNVAVLEFADVGARKNFGFGRVRTLYLLRFWPLSSGALGLLPGGLCSKPIY